MNRKTIQRLWIVIDVVLGKVMPNKIQMDFPPTMIYVHNDGVLRPGIKSHWIDKCFVTRYTRHKLFIYRINAFLALGHKTKRAVIMQRTITYLEFWDSCVNKTNFLSFKNRRLAGDLPCDSDLSSRSRCPSRYPLVQMFHSHFFPRITKSALRNADIHWSLWERR